MSYLIKRLRADVKGIDPGMRNEVYIAPLSWFAVLNEPTAPFTNPGDEYQIATAHTFIEDKGFIKAYLLPFQNEQNSESIGDVGVQTMDHKAKILVPGDDKGLYATVQEFLNEDLIVLIEDRSCPNGSMYQLGCECKPCNVEKATYASGARKGDLRGWTLDLIAECRWYYTSTVTLHPEPEV